MVAGVAALALATSNAYALSANGVAGFEYSSGPDDQLTRSVLGAGVLDFGNGTDAMVALVRFDDFQAGPGWGVITGLGLPLVPSVQARGWITRLTAANGYEAWRFKVGPQFHAPSGATIGLWYSHFQSGDTLRSDGAMLEATVPLVERLGAKLGASAATLPQQLTSLQASAGLSWTPISRVELSGELGVAENGSITSLGPVPGRLGGLLPGPDQKKQSNEVSPTAVFGVRVSFP